MLQEEELQSQIEELRLKRKEKQQSNDNFDVMIDKKPKAKKEKKDDGILGVFTFQSIIVVIIAIIYVVSLSFSKPQTNEIVHAFKDKLVNDFSFKDKVYESVGSFITYLNKISPINKEQLKGAGGEFINVEGNKMPENVTFAPVIYTGRITYPIKTGRVTSKFGFRTNPVNNKPDFHNALDIAAPIDTPIMAAADGVVIKSEKDDSLGNYIVIDHSNGFTTTYGHCDRLIAKVGMRIREGEIIARVGSTGKSTGPHVHFATCKDSLYFNPEYLFGKTY